MCGVIQAKWMDPIQLLNDASTDVDTATATATDADTNVECTERVY